MRLIGLIVTMAIILVLTVFFLKGPSMFSTSGGGSSRKDGMGTTIPGAARAKAFDDVCMSNLKQVRMSISISHDSNGDEGYPATIEETRLGKDFYRCPLGHEPYSYDPQTGTVKCVHPGHEKY